MDNIISLEKNGNSPVRNRTPSPVNESYWLSEKFFVVPTVFQNVKNAESKLGRKTDRTFHRTEFPIIFVKAAQRNTSITSSV
jgi:hypothetical protein